MTITLLLSSHELILFIILLSVVLWDGDQRKQALTFFSPIDGFSILHLLLVDMDLCDIQTRAQYEKAGSKMNQEPVEWGTSVQGYFFIILIVLLFDLKF